jgi:uncharacterized protein YgbK (DUF1537 family)
MRFCILADDLTGANATASLLKREGLPSHTHLFPRPPHGGAPASLREDGAHVLDLDTRELTGGEAASRLAIACGWLGAAPDLVGLRIDSTLRGPIPASIDALLVDQRRLALVVPAFPASGRTTRDGVHYVYGVPLAETQVAHDPHCPVTDSHVGEWIGGRIVAASAMLALDAVRHGHRAIATLLVRSMAAGARAVFCDAETDHDIAEIARAALAVQNSHRVAILPVDPGPFTATLVRLMMEPRRLSPLVFGIVGSVMDTSRQQMDFVEADSYAFVVRYNGQSARELLAAFKQAPLSVKAMLPRTNTALLDPNGKLRFYDTLADIGFPPSVATGASSDNPVDFGAPGSQPDRTNENPSRSGKALPGSAAVCGVLTAASAHMLANSMMRPRLFASYRMRSLPRAGSVGCRMSKPLRYSTLRAHCAVPCPAARYLGFRDAMDPARQVPCRSAAYRLPKHRIPRLPPGFRGREF